LFTFQVTLVVGAPVTFPVNASVLLVPAVKVAEVGEIETVGGGRIVTAAEADKFWSSNDMTVTVIADVGTVAGAW
jgi:hypothetical protein